MMMMKMITMIEEVEDFVEVMERDHLEEVVKTR